MRDLAPSKACRPPQAESGERDERPDLAAPLGLDPGHQGRQVDCQRPGEPVDIDHAHVPAAALDVADGARVEAGLLGKTFLREPALQPQRPDGLSKGDENIGGRFDGHLSTLREETTSAPCTMSGLWEQEPGTLRARPTRWMVLNPALKWR